MDLFYLLLHPPPPGLFHSLAQKQGPRRGRGWGGLQPPPPPHFFENYKELPRKKCFQPPPLWVTSQPPHFQSSSAGPEKSTSCLFIAAAEKIYKVYTHVILNYNPRPPCMNPLSDTWFNYFSTTTRAAQPSGNVWSRGFARCRSLAESNGKGNAKDIKSGETQEKVERWSSFVFCAPASV